MKYGLVFLTCSRIQKVNGYSALNEKKYDETNLQDITKFTSKFNNEEELIEYLYYNNLIDSLEGKIKIYAEKKNIPLKLLNDGLTFKQDSKYYDFDIIASFFTSNITNPSFMTLFLDKYYSYLRYTPYFSYPLNKIKEAYDYYIINHLLPKDSQMEMLNFLNLYTLRKEKNRFKRDFTKIRDLAMFIINYTNKDNKNSHPTYDDNETKCLINHYKMLLKSEDLPLEEVNAYEDAINNLEENLILRRKK